MGLAIIFPSRPSLGKVVTNRASLQPVSRRKPRERMLRRIIGSAALAWRSRRCPGRAGGLASCRWLSKSLLCSWLVSHIAPFARPRSSPVPAMAAGHHVVHPPTMRSARSASQPCAETDLDLSSFRPYFRGTAAAYQPSWVGNALDRRSRTDAALHSFGPTHAIGIASAQLCPDGGSNEHD